MTGEFLFFAIYVLQQLGVMLGVGAQTVLLCTHLIAVHKGEAENLQSSFAYAARRSLLIGFFLIIGSGMAAIGVHVTGGNLNVLLAPVFGFKWALIGIVLCAFWLQNLLSHWSNMLAGFAGGTWYALFLVHSLAPVTSWLNLIGLYFVWLALFMVFWGAFVFIMRKAARAPQKKVVASAVVQIKTPVPPPLVPTPKPMPPPPKPLPPPVFKPTVVTPLPPKPTPPPPVVPKPTAVLVSPPVFKPAVPPPVAVPPKPAGPSLFKRLGLWLRNFFASKTPAAPASQAVATPVMPKPIPPAPPPPPAPKSIPSPPLPPKPPDPVHPLELAAVSVPLSLPVPPKPAPAPVPSIVHKPAAHPYPPVPVVLKIDSPDYTFNPDVPAMRVMPAKPEDIGKQNRPPVVDLNK